MVSDWQNLRKNLSPYLVLILVLMEYGLWRRRRRGMRRMAWVLILVLMEYGLWPTFDAYVKAFDSVLILVLMEYGLWLRI